MLEYNWYTLLRRAQFLICFSLSLSLFPNKDADIFQDIAQCLHNDLSLLCIILHFSLSKKLMDVTGKKKTNKKTPRFPFRIFKFFVTWDYWHKDTGHCRTHLHLKSCGLLRCLEWIKSLTLLSLLWATGCQKREILKSKYSKSLFLRTLVVHCGMCVSMKMESYRTGKRIEKQLFLKGKYISKTTLQSLN